MINRILICLIGLGASASAMAAWTAPARDDGIAVACRTAADRAAFDQLLDRAGWSKYGQRRPAIDFARSIAVIVAPGRFRADADLKLVAVTVGNGRRTVRWRFAPRVQMAERAEESISLGSSGPPGKEILVVAFPRAALGFRQSCVGTY